MSFVRWVVWIRRGSADRPQCAVIITIKRQLVTRSGLPRLTCCVCHLHHKWTIQSPAGVREFFKKVLQQVCHFEVDVIAGDANAAAYTYYKKQEYQDLHDSSVSVMLREMQREVNPGH